MKTKTQKVAAIVSLLLLGILATSCGNNNSKSNASSTPAVCPICGESMEGKTAVKCTTAKGEMTVCSDCYAIGKQTGYCY